MSVEGARQPDQIELEAAEWVTRVELGELSEVERASFLAWLMESPVHVREYLGMAEAWSLVNARVALETQSIQTLLAEASAMPPATDLREFRETRSEAAKTSLRAAPGPRESVPHPIPFWTRRGNGTWAIALTFALITAGGLFEWHHSRTRGTTWATSTGEQRSLELPDGSLLELNAVSEARVAMNDGVRRVHLHRGEALFQVASDPARPFEVLTADAIVVAVGTRFNVNTRNGATEVAVLEGKVRLTARDDRRVADLGPNETAIVMHDRAIRTAVKSRVADSVAWTERRLIFENASLAFVMSEFNLYNQLQLRSSDFALKDLRISGVFFANDPLAFVAFLEGIQGIDIVRDPRHVTLNRRPDYSPPDVR